MYMYLYITLNATKHKYLTSEESFGENQPCYHSDFFLWCICNIRRCLKDGRGGRNTCCRGRAASFPVVGDTYSHRCRFFHGLLRGGQFKAPLTKDKGGPVCCLWLMVIWIVAVKRLRSVCHRYFSARESASSVFWVNLCLFCLLWDIYWRRKFRFGFGDNSTERSEPWRRCGLQLHKKSRYFCKHQHGIHPVSIIEGVKNSRPA